MRALPLFLALPMVAGCPSMPAPASPMPSAAAAIARARASSACGTAVMASAKLDHFGERGRFRGDLLLFAAAPSSVRMDVVSPFGVALATLTADGRAFALRDLHEKRFFHGPAAACNIARLTGVALPPHVLVTLLRGQPPLLRHEEASMTIAWSGRGYYIVRVPSTRSASQELHLAPHPDDRQKAWSDQRLRLVDIRVDQGGRTAWHARLDGHAPAPMAAARIDDAGIDSPVPPSGPACTADLPRRIEVEVPDEDQDVRVRYDQVTWNPPLPEGTFLQTVPGDMPAERVDCAR